MSEAATEWDLMLPCNDNLNTEDKAVMYMIRKLGGEDGLERQKKSTGQTAMMTHTLGFPHENGEFEYVTREVHYPIIYQSKKSEQIDDYRIFEMLADIKAHMTTHNRTKLAIPELEGVDGIILYRMVRYLFSDSVIQLVAHKRRNMPNKRKDISSNSKQNRENVTEPNRNKSKPKQEGVVVKVEGKSYTEVLQTVKQSINPTEVGVEVTGVKKTKKGDLLLMVKKGSEKVDSLRKTISLKVPEAKATLLSKKRVFHVKNLDELTTVEDLREALAKELSVNSEAFEVRALRPTSGNRQNATVILTESLANKFSKIDKIKVG